MKLQTQISIKRAQNQMDYHSQLLILGSCFAENMGDALKHFKFQCLQNPFGILFHPKAITKFISKAVLEEKYAEKEVFFLNERWHCFDAHSLLSDVSKENLLHNLNQGLAATRKQIKEATHIVITLGTAWVYHHIDTDITVANCHKVPQKEFSKTLLSVTEIQKSLNELYESIAKLNNNVQFVFTVSPVRHLKDGFVENQRSKAHLLTAVHQFISEHDAKQQLHYFPSFEIMMDELRDYRFYTADMLHPNQTAIDYIWENFVSVWISPNSIASMKKVDEVQKGFSHRPFNPNSEQHRNFLKSLEEKKTYLLKEHPFMKFDV